MSIVRNRGLPALHTLCSRREPSTSTAILGVAQPGANAQVISRQKEWVQIIDPGSNQPGLPALSRAEIEAALETPDEVDILPSEPSTSVKLRKSQKHRWRNSHRKRGFALRRQTGMVSCPSILTSF